MAVGTTEAEGQLVKNGQMLLKNLRCIGKIVKIYEMLLKKLHFGRSGKTFW